jgi:hypothetical protein
MVQQDAVVIRLGEGGSLLADASSLFGGCRDCSGQHHLSVGQLGSPNSPERSRLAPRT